MIKRYMKHGKIDFFESPHPTHFHFYLHREPVFAPAEDPDIHQHKLFATPTQPTQHALLPAWDIDPLITFAIQQQDPEKEQDQPQSSDSAIIQQYQSQSPPEINQKLEFSNEEQDLLIALTPEKRQILDNDDQEFTTTIRRKSPHQYTPSSEMRFCQRGLKKLAYEAYLFVSNQKRTTYKEVAKKLINQMSDDHEMDIQKKGEMNIKRRVYDALNVLIALGLLKRNGNKILGKKPDDNFTIERNCQRQNKFEGKDQSLYDECDKLKKQLQSRHEQVQQKQRMIQTLRQKITSIKDLTDRNQKIAQTNNRITFPFVILCGREKDQKKVQIEGNNNLTICEENGDLKVIFPTGSLQINGDLDSLPLLKTSTVSQKPERSKRRYR